MSTAAPTPVNGSNVNGSPAPNTTLNPTGGRQQLKMNSSTKSSDGTRKQAGSPVDGAQRKAPPPKAWTQGTNPITQRPSNLSNANGVNTSKHSQNPTQISSESPGAKQILNERMMYLLHHFTGRAAEITLKNGELYSGVLSGTSLDPNETRYVFKMVKRLRSEGPVNGVTSVPDEYIGQGESHVMSFDVGDCADVTFANTVLDGSQTKSQNGASVGFRTDTDISGNTSGRERHLQRWEPSTEPTVDYSLETPGRPTEWDQFSTNERMFGVKSDYDENIYTTTINRNDPRYAQKAAHAERIAREIESSSALNAHVREERGQTIADDKGGDEEDKYSGVHRDFQPLGGGGLNKYTPPARRPPTSQPTVPGAPVDPAIISSQIARPDSAAAKAAQRTASPAEKRATPEPSKPEVTVKAEESASSKPEPPKDAAPKIEATATSSEKAAPLQPEKPSSALKPALSSLPGRRLQGRADNATANVENELLDSFKQFANQEKLKVAERQRHTAHQNKAVRLNDLKKFSQNFKLRTPVPQDLVPILAKDESKQKEIVQKALRAAAEKEASSTQSTPTVEAKAPTATPAVKPGSAHASPAAPENRQQSQRPRPGPNQYGSTTMRVGLGNNQNLNQGQKSTGLLSQRLAYNQQQHKQQGGLPYNHVPYPIPQGVDRTQEFRAPTGPSGPPSGVQSPASRFNIGAHVFRPNPAAHTFQPGGAPSANSSPRPDSASKQESPVKPQEPRKSDFFGGKKPSVAKLDLATMFNPIHRMLNENKGAPAESPVGRNGGVPPSFKTPPTWDYPVENNDKDYITIVEQSATVPPVSASINPANNGTIPHQHQLPPHLQGGPPQGPALGPTPGHTPRHLPVQPHHGQGGGPHFEAQSMQFSHSTSSVHPSPRAMAPYMYGTQPQAMPGFPQQAQMHYGMSPVPPHAALRQQGGHQFMNAPVPGMGGQMMTNQHSNGSFMGMPTNPQMQMYSPTPNPGYPHYPNQMPGPSGPNGYPNSPRPGAQMMHPQGSQQGHQQQQFVYMPQGGPPMFTQMPPGPMAPMRQQPYPQAHQPQHYGSPQQHHQFPQAHRGTSSGNFSQPMMQQHSMPPQGPPPTGPTNHNQDSNEEAK